MRTTRDWTLAGVTTLTAMARLLPLPPNFAPVGAVALFGGAHFSRRPAAMGVPLVAMLLSDGAIGLSIALGADGFALGAGLKGAFANAPFVYPAFLAMVGIGMVLRRRRGLASATVAALGSAVLFFLVTNFGVWLMGGWLMPATYPSTLGGLGACYLAGMPFFRATLGGAGTYVLFESTFFLNTLLSTTGYTLLLFGGVSLAERWVPALREEPAAVPAGA